jgi:hypothetical protein
MLIPNLIRGGILCGDDYMTAHKGRKDLDGGVERAVNEMLQGVNVVGNLWWYQHS